MKPKKVKVLLISDGFKGGPKAFCTRIIPAFSKTNSIKIITDPSEDFDVELAIIKSRAKHDKPIVVRMDGCYYRNKDLVNNHDIAVSLQNANHVIFQSDFSRRMVHSIVNINPRSESIINNGIDLKSIKRISPLPGIVPDSFLMVASNWQDRPNKRFLSTISGYLEASPDKPLYVIGDVKISAIRQYGDPRIVFLKKMRYQKVLSVMMACKYLLHLCRIDSCPNAVVEGLACGLNVLCTNLGGTREIVKNDGIILDVDQWNLRPIKSLWDDALDKRVVADGISRLVKMDTIPMRKDLDIRLVAKQYARILRRVAGA